jgi:AraC family transcriptional regulator
VTNQSAYGGSGAFRLTATGFIPLHFRETAAALRMPVSSFGFHEVSSLKASCWHTGPREIHHKGDAGHVALFLHLGGGRIRLNGGAMADQAGSAGMAPFQSSHWRFEGSVRFMNVYIPFALLAEVHRNLFDKELSRDQFWIPMGVRHEGLHHALRRVQRGLADVSGPTRLILDSWALILCEVLVRNFARAGGKGPGTPSGAIPLRGIAHAVDFVESNLHRDLRLESLAGAASMSLFHFARRFKQAVGKSPHQYVVQRRVDRARNMLASGEDRIVDVATACGFSSQAHLTTAFRRALGVTPGAYRQAWTSGSGVRAGRRHVETIQQHGNEAVAADQEHKFADAFPAKQMRRAAVG